MNPVFRIFLFAWGLAAAALMTAIPRITGTALGYHSELLFGSLAAMAVVATAQIAFGPTPSQQAAPRPGAGRLREIVRVVGVGLVCGGAVIAGVLTATPWLAWTGFLVGLTQMLPGIGRSAGLKEAFLLLREH